jgi:predicted alpha/beta-fold hydrolase
MVPTLSGTLSLFTAPPAPRIPRSPKDVTSEGSGSSRKYPYFTSGDLDSEKAVIFLGGLTNGMGAVPYVHKLSEELKGAGWRLYVTRERGQS